jgi:hypothetical protein
MNAYYTSTRTNIQRRYERTNSEAIRRTYLANTRKKAILDFINSIAEGIDSKMLWNAIMTLKIVSGIICAIGFFAVVSLIESGSLSIGSGLGCTAIIAAIECLCFIPMGNKQRLKK